MKKLILVLAVSLGIATQANAGYTTGTIDNLLVGRLGNEVYVGMIGSPTAQPCLTNGILSGYQYAFSLNEQGGKEQYQTLLAAYFFGHQVQIVGTGQCSSYNNKLEEVSYVTM